MASSVVSCCTASILRRLCSDGSTGVKSRFIPSRVAAWNALHSAGAGLCSSLALATSATGSGVVGSARAFMLLARLGRLVIGAISDCYYAALLAISQRKQLLKPFEEVGDFLGRLPFRFVFLCGLAGGECMGERGTLMDDDGCDLQAVLLDGLGRILDEARRSGRR